ncbi:hypothetical protein [Fulvimarina sp. MAC3]|uniref:hypothetical protein n=1 Tax=Fulvimarina sp. MAC3 TaxID=3148887 RepID=UPI0031FD266C
MNSKPLQSALIACLACLAAVPPAAARSKAAQWLVGEALKEACGKGGTIDDSGVIERDLDGDGPADLIIAHDAVQCPAGPSATCGNQVCAVKIYLRRGSLLEEFIATRGSAVKVGTGSPPPISMRLEGGGEVTARWDGQTFR